MANNNEYRRWQAHYERSSASPGAARAILQMNTEIMFDTCCPQSQFSRSFYTAPVIELSEWKTADTFASASRVPIILSCLVKITTAGPAILTHSVMRSKSS